MIESYITQVEESMSEAWNAFYETQAEAADGRDEAATAISTAKAMIFFISEDLAEIVATQDRKKEALLSIAAALHESLIDALAEQWRVNGQTDSVLRSEYIFAAIASAIPAGLRIVDQMLEASATAEGDQNGAH